ncbi:hypothetical protein GQX73_g1421 [Xylaria multiplex]|uniref:BZIP domain-containing protein n=1 Tax=Xylaria multiplex TaxID=323545 RepID=A0A7C8ITS4_9PEZI|nr:hypothetical protein GQX73_g1421 [Xylaria multiplex]
MQVLDSRSHADTEHDVYTLAPNGVEDLPFYDINTQDHTPWRAPPRIWQLDNFSLQHQPMDHAGYSEQVCIPTSRAVDFISTYPILIVQQQPAIRTRSNDGHQAEYFHLPFEEWPSNLVLDAACDRYKNPTTSSATTLYPPTARSSLVAIPETFESSKYAELNDGPSSPISPTSPRGGPTSQKKRIRNRLAAAKCRRKAKRGVDELQQKERDLLRENKMLSAQAGLLREEVLLLKTEILRHNECDNDYIRQYIRRSAAQVGKALSGDRTRGTLNYVDYS